MSLKDTWTLYWHNPDPKSSWDNDSYEKYASVKTVREAGGLCRALKNLWSIGSFYLMKNVDEKEVLPKWENFPRGGCLSIKVGVENANDTWSDAMFYGLVGIEQENRDSIVGMSISNKRDFVLIRFWLSEDRALKLTGVQTSKSMTLYKPHMDSLMGKKLFSKEQFKKGPSNRYVPNRW